MKRFFVLLFLAMLVISTGLSSAMAEQPTISTKEMMQKYEDVMLGKSSYIQCNRYDDLYREATMPSEIHEWYGYEFEEPLKFEAFCITDLDGDGNIEIILKLSEYFGFELLRYENGQVYGFPFVYRAMEDITLEGDIHGSSGAADSSWYQLRFNAEKLEEIETCRMQSTGTADIQYFIGDKEVSEGEYTKFCETFEDNMRPIWVGFSQEQFKAVVSSF